MEPEDRKRAEAACRATVERFAACLDEFDDQGVLELVTADCLWHGAPRAHGHAEIRTRLAGRSRNLRTLHVVTGTVADLENPAEARARTVVTVYRFDAAAAVAPPGLPRTIGTYHDRFRREDGRWLISERRLIPLAQA